LKHLESDYIDDIALCLDEDVYGASGGLSEEEIFDRLIAKIHESTQHSFIKSGMVPVRTVGHLS
jgi:hypothetical protein